MKRILVLFLVTALLISVWGCTPKSEYEKLMDQKTAVEKKLDATAAEKVDLQKTIGAGQMEIKDLRKQVSDAQVKVKDLENFNQLFKKKYDKMLSKHFDQKNRLTIDVDPVRMI